VTTARANHRALRYETTVGASLPVIETLKNLVRTGDKVLRIEGSLSGTLGYLCNELMRGVRLSEAVATARELGFTEPHPGDDLSGLDAARKALILARELGMRATLEAVDVTPLVPHELLAERDLGRFFARLQRHDAGVGAELEQLRARGLVRRYLAQIDPGAGTIRVGPVDVELDHPATRLRGSEAFVAFSTARYGDRPLVVQGAGAGGAVTAAGVLADVLSIAQALRGR
jgi:aspartokinase/homoserine dehydrogenase 1